MLNYKCKFDSAKIIFLFHYKPTEWTPWPCVPILVHKVVVIGIQCQDGEKTKFILRKLAISPKKKPFTDLQSHVNGRFDDDRGLRVLVEAEHTFWFLHGAALLKEGLEQFVALHNERVEPHQVRRLLAEPWGGGGEKFDSIQLATKPEFLPRARNA